MRERPLVSITAPSELHLSSHQFWARPAGAFHELAAAVLGILAGLMERHGFLLLQLSLPILGSCWLCWHLLALLTLWYILALFFCHKCNLTPLTAQGTQSVSCPHSHCRNDRLLSTVVLSLHLVLSAPLVLYFNPFLMVERRQLFWLFPNCSLFQIFLH